MTIFSIRVTPTGTADSRIGTTTLAVEVPPADTLNTLDFRLDDTKDRTLGKSQAAGPGPIIEAKFRNIVTVVSVPFSAKLVGRCFFPR